VQVNSRACQNRSRHTCPPPLQLRGRKHLGSRIHCVHLLRILDKPNLGNGPVGYTSDGNSCGNEVETHAAKVRPVALEAEPAKLPPAR